LELDSENLDDLNMDKYVNVELEDDFFKKLNENEDPYKSLLEEIQIPLSIYKQHFE